MGRPKRRTGGRVTPKKSRPTYYDELGADFVFYDRDYRREVQVQTPDDPYTERQLEWLARDAEHILAECCAEGEADLDEADCWASCIQSAVKSGWCQEGVDASAVVAYAERAGGLPGAMLAAAMAAYGPPECRAGAGSALRCIRGSGPGVPGWIDALGEAEPLRAVRVADRWGEYIVLIIDYERPDGSVHGLSVAINPFCGGLAERFSLGAPSTALDASGDDAGALLAAYAAAHRRGRVPDGASFAPVTAEVALADARAVIEAGLLVFDAAVPEADDFDCDLDMRALVEQRIGLLPAGGRVPARPAPVAEAMAGWIADFASRPLCLGERPGELGDLLHTMVGFAVSCRDQDILRWTPPRVAAFLEGWIPEHGMYCQECGESHEHPPDEEWLTTVESAFPRWLRFSDERAGAGSGFLDDNLAAARGSLRQMRLQATGSPVRLR